MRASVALLVLCCLSAPALAHDAEAGLLFCYSGKHCPQNTLVFGVVTEVNDRTYTVVVRKVLRTKGDVIAGMRIHLVNPGQKRPSWLYQEPVLNGGVLVSFLKKGHAPYRPHYQVRSTTTDWRKMTVDTGYRNDLVDGIERLVRSGGTAYGFFGKDEHIYMVTGDGKMKRVDTEVDLGTLLPKASAPSRASAKTRVDKSRTRQAPAGPGAVRPATAKEARRPGATVKEPSETAPAASR